VSAATRGSSDSDRRGGSPLTVLTTQKGFVITSVMSPAPAAAPMWIQEELCGRPLASASAPFPYS
jgi:hypothetical protein